MRLLVADVLPAAPLASPGSLIDVGSGNGSPGLVFALVRDDLEVTLLEPRARRWAFLREAARASSRGVRVQRVRHDGYAGEPAHTVTLRAVALPLAEIAPLVLPGGRLLVLGGHPEGSGPFDRTREGEGIPGGVTVFRRFG